MNNLNRIAPYPPCNRGARTFKTGKYVDRLARSIFESNFGLDRVRSLGVGPCQWCPNLLPKKEMKLVGEMPRK
jgi:hypothetical protein